MKRSSARRRGDADAAKAKTPTFISRVALCRLAQVSEGQLRLWEEEELIVPTRFVELHGRREPLYTPKVLQRVRLIRTLAEDLEVNLPGIDVILNLLDRFGR